MNVSHRGGVTHKPLLIVLAGLLMAVLAVAVVSVASRARTPMSPRQQHGSPRASSDTHSSLDRTPNVAAVVNGSTISVSRVRKLALQSAGPIALDQLIGDALIDQEARRRLIVVTPAEIDDRIDVIRNGMQPNGLDESLRARHMSLQDLSKEIRVQIEVKKLIGATLPPITMSHIADISIGIHPAMPNGPQARSATQAKSLVESLRNRLGAGVSFGDLAKQYSDDRVTKDNGGDLGVVSNVPNSAVNPAANFLCSQPEFRSTAFKLKRGQVALIPMRSNRGYHLIMAVSTAANHDSSESPLYRAAEVAARDSQLAIQAPKYVQSLHGTGRVTVYTGKQLSARPTVAAVVNGYSIPLARVEDLAYRLAGEAVVHRLIDVTLVDQEARKQNIVVSPADIDAKIAKLRGNMEAKSFQAMLRNRNMSMDELRESVRIELTSNRLVWKAMGPLKLAHVRHIFLLTNAESASEFPGAKPRSESEARVLMTRIQSALHAGKKFDDLARQYSDDPVSKAKGGDLGVIQPETRFGGSLYQAATTLQRGEITAQPVTSVDGLHLIMAVSTDSDHPAAEDSLYARTADHVHTRELQVFLHSYIKHLRGSSKIVDNLDVETAPRSHQSPS